MGKKLISAKCVEEFICRASGKIYVDNTMILSPSAKDHIRNNGITIVYGPRPEVVDEVPAAEAAPVCDAQEKAVDASDDAKLIVAVAEILKKDFGITDPEQMIAISAKVVTIIKSNK